VSATAKHVPFAQIADIAEGRPSPDEQDLRAHVSLCSRCTADLDWLNRLFRLARTDDMEDAPAHVVNRAARLLRQVSAPRAAGPVRQVLGALRFDSARTAALGVRAGQASARQLLFSADDHDVDLRTSPAGPLWSVAGQVLGPGEGGAALLTGPAGQAEAALNDMLEFSLPPVPAGDYTLLLRIGDTEIELPGLELGGSSV